MASSRPTLLDHADTLLILDLLRDHLDGGERVLADPPRFGD
jgi:hypothetical protein